MIITALEKKSRNRTALSVDGVIRVWLSDDIIFKNGLAVGDEISEAELDELIGNNDEIKAREKALSLLDRRDHSAGELKFKLNRAGINDELSDRVICDLAECGIVDDERFAMLFLDELIDRRHYSKKRCRFELIKKYISKDIVESVLSQKFIDDSDTVYELITGKYINKMHDDASRKNLLLSLMRNGFSWSDIKSAFLRFDEEYGLT